MTKIQNITGNALDLIGNTPLVRLSRAYDGPGQILAKAEFMQPGGSMKDRNGLFAILGARERGELAPDQPVVEMTSGNMGAGLAVACACLGHPFFAFMSEGNSIARAHMMEAFGAKVVRVPQVEGEPGKVTNKDIEVAKAEAIKKAKEINAFYVDQWNNVDCVRAHEDGLAPEIYSQTNGQIDAYVMAVGSAAAFVGSARYLKGQNPNIKCFAVEPEGSEPLAGKDVLKPTHLIQGTGYAHIPDRWQTDLVDGTISVSDEEATLWREKLGAEEALFVGFSAAANVCAATKLIASGQLGVNPTVVTLLCDTGLKY